MRPKTWKTVTAAICLIGLALAAVFRVSARPRKTSSYWHDPFDDEMGLHERIDTGVPAGSGHLALAPSESNPAQYITSGIAASHLINPLVSVVSTPERFIAIAAGQGDFLYFMTPESGGYMEPALTKFYSYQLSTGQFQHIRDFDPAYYPSLTSGTNGSIYISIGEQLYGYDPASDQVSDLGKPIPGSEILKLASAPSGLIYGIAGIRLFVYDPAAHTTTDLGILNDLHAYNPTLTVAPNGTVYGGYPTNSGKARLFVYDPDTDLIVDKGHVLDHYSINVLVVGLDGRIYGGTNTNNGALGSLFAYDAATGLITDLTRAFNSG